MSFLLMCFFRLYATIIDWLANMNLYVSNILEYYKDTIIGHYRSSGIEELLLQIVYFWCPCAVEK